MHKLGLDFFGAGSIEKSRRIVSKLRDFTFRIANFGEEFGTENEKESVFRNFGIFNLVGIYIRKERIFFIFA